MNRNLVIAIIAVVAIVIGWLLFGNRTAVDTAVQDAATTATQTATEAAQTATEAATGAAQTATEAATDAAQTATDAVAALLDPANFDAEKIKGAIDAATALDDATKTTLKSAVDAAAADPTLVQSTIDQVKAALGL